MGMKVDTFRKKNPEIAMAYDLYAACRLQQLFSVEVPKGKQASLRILPYTTGYGILPYAGGMLDQPHRLMALWSHFFEGDRMVTFKSLS